MRMMESKKKTMPLIGIDNDIYGVGTLRYGGTASSMSGGAGGANTVGTAFAGGAGGSYGGGAGGNGAAGIVIVITYF